jgi:hypothetical protein
MSVEHVILVTCDRCMTAAHYRHNDSEWCDRYARRWPAQVTPYTGPAYGPSATSPGPDGVVCLDCLTDDERAQLAAHQERRRAQELFGAREEWPSDW